MQRLAGGERLRRWGLGEVQLLHRGDLRWRVRSGLPFLRSRELLLQDVLLLKQFGEYLSLVHLVLPTYNGHALQALASLVRSATWCAASPARGDPKSL